MPWTIEDTLSISLVFPGITLLSNAEEVASFQRAVSTEVVPQDLVLSHIGIDPHSSAVSGKLLQLPRDRINIESSVSRSSIARDYPSREGLPQYCEIVRRIIAETAAFPSSPDIQFGVNVSLVFNQDSDTTAASYIGNRVFGSQLRDLYGAALIGGSAKFSVSTDDGLLNFTLEPRRNAADTSRVFLQLNHHFNNKKFPLDDELDELIMYNWDLAHSFISDLDGRVGS